MKKSEVKVVLYEKDNTVAFQGNKILEDKEVSHGCVYLCCVYMPVF
jgi:hypothetical protein